MTQETTDLFKQANYRQVQNRQLELLRELKDERLTIGHNGGMFNINPTLLNLLDLLERKGYETAVIDDRNNNPIEVEVKEASKGKITELVTASGEIQPEVEVRVSPEVPERQMRNGTPSRSMKQHENAASRRSLAVANGVPTRVEPHGDARRHYRAALQAAAALRRRLCGRWERYDGDALRECERRDFQPSFTACTHTACANF